MYHSLIKKIVFLSLVGFFLAVLAISLHHHDNSFSLPTCSICKVKTSLSGTFSKIKVDSAPTVASHPSFVDGDLSVFIRHFT